MGTIGRVLNAVLTIVIIMIYVNYLTMIRNNKEVRNHG